MMTYEDLDALASSRDRTSVCLFDRERHNLTFLPDQAGESDGERLGNFIRRQHGEVDDHHGWLHYFEDFVVHGANTRLPWKSHGDHPHLSFDGRAGRSSVNPGTCAAYGEAAGMLGHAVVVRAGSKFASALLISLKEVHSASRKRNLSFGERFQLFRQAVAENGGKFDDMLRNAFSGAVGSTAVEIFHGILEYFESCWLDFVRALRCSTHTLIDTVQSLSHKDISLNERIAIGLKGVSAAGIIIGSEILEKTIAAKLNLVVPPGLNGYKDLVVHMIAAIGVLLAIWVVSKVLDELLRVEAARDAMALVRGCETLNGRAMNEHRARSLRMSGVARGTDRSG